MIKLNGVFFAIFATSLVKSLPAQVPDKIEPFIAPFGEFNFVRPEFPDKTVSILDYGATSGGEQLNTGAINSAIRELSSAGGGKVIVPSGKWLTGPITLLSNVNLYLQEGAELVFSQNFSDYLPAVLTNWEGSEVYSYSPFIYAIDQENIAITGKGVLNGQGKPWWEHRRKGGFARSNNRLKEMNNNQVPVSERVFDNMEDYLPPVFFGPLRCTNVLVEGVTFRYGAFWTINPSFCKNVIVRGVYILTNGDYGDTPNGDGINPNSCQNVLIEYNTLDTGDDCITIKSGRDNDGRRIGMPCKNILIRHNTGLQGHGGIVIGSEMSGGVENVFAHDCHFNGTDRVIRIKTQRGRGGYVKNCWFKNISADTILKEAIRINMLYSGTRLPEKQVTDGTPYIENIHYENIQCKYSAENVIQIIGIPEMPVRNITFKNISLGGKKGIEIIDAKNITLDGISVVNKTGPVATFSYSDKVGIEEMDVVDTDSDAVPFQYTDVTNSSLTNLKTRQKGQLVSISGKSENIKIDKSVAKNQIRYSR